MPKVYPYPLGFDLAWHRGESAAGCEPNLYNWLLDTSSLTERLQAHCRQFRVDVLGQAVAPVSPSERSLLIECDEAEVREVLLMGDGEPWVFARSILPRSLLDANIDNIAGLGQQPLGQIIFNDRRFVRQPFEVTQLQPTDPLVGSLGLDADWPLWGRRSLFCFAQYRLLVAEVFLPTSPAYKHFARK